MYIGFGGMPKSGWIFLCALNAAFWCCCEQLLDRSYTSDYHDRHCPEAVASLSWWYQHTLWYPHLGLIHCGVEEPLENADVICGEFASVMVFICTRHLFSQMQH